MVCTWHALGVSEVSSHVGCTCGLSWCECNASIHAQSSLVHCTSMIYSSVCIVRYSACKAFARARLSLACTITPLHVYLLRKYSDHASCFLYIRGRAAVSFFGMISLGRGPPWSLILEVIMDWAKKLVFLLTL